MSQVIFIPIKLVDVYKIKIYTLFFRKTIKDNKNFYAWLSLSWLNKLLRCFLKVWFLKNIISDTCKFLMWNFLTKLKTTVEISLFTLLKCNTEW
jgi:hypothetical protein